MNEVLSPFVHRTVPLHPLMVKVVGVPAQDVAELIVGEGDIGAVIVTERLSEVQATLEPLRTRTL